MTEIRPLREVMREVVARYTLDEIKEAAIRAALDTWSVKVAADRLGINQSTIYVMMSRYKFTRTNGHQAKLFQKSKNSPASSL
jgi:transposase-like protein